MFYFYMFNISPMKMKVIQKKVRIWCTLGMACNQNWKLGHTWKLNEKISNPEYVPNTAWIRHATSPFLNNNLFKKNVAIWKSKSWMTTCIYLQHILANYVWISQHVVSKYKWLVHISTFIAKIYLKGLLIRKILVASLKCGLKIIENSRHVEIKGTDDFTLI